MILTLGMYFIMFNYFENLNLESEIKERFKKLAKENHPDKGGSLEVMKEINNQYDNVLKGIFQKSGKSITEIEELLKDSNLIREKLMEILLCPGLIIELCGSWIWITGDTKLAKELLKGAGFMWASKKVAWYWHKPQDTFKRWCTKFNLEMIRDKYGSEKITNLGSYRASLT